MALIDLIAGARPNFMKIAPIIHAIRDRRSFLDFRLIHTGQHYDRSMSASFFEQLGIPDPAINFGVGSGTQAEQTGQIMCAYETLLQEHKSDACIVVGDVTSTMATTVAAKKSQISVAHVEGGIRSGDWSMPEEINRRITDSITDWFFTTSEFANANLQREGVSSERVFYVGNTMIDTLVRQLDNLRPPMIWDELNLEPAQFLVLTLHRPSNVDAEAQLANTLETIGEIVGDTKVIYPIHPRSARTLEQAFELPENIYLIPPQPYLEFNFLVQNSLAVITDSGGITEETTFLGIPCMTLRENTERPETIEIGTNELIGNKPENLAPYMDRLKAGNWKPGGIPSLWDGKAGDRIVDHLEQLLS
jgi:UDP-N-acetylglucosamine 2-epimerase (non-hydrolysing)